MYTHLAWFCTRIRIRWNAKRTRRLPELWVVVGAKQRERMHSSLNHLSRLRRALKAATTMMRMARASQHITNGRWPWGFVTLEGSVMCGADVMAVGTASW